MINSLLLVAFGGAIGSAARFSVSKFFLPVGIAFTYVSLVNIIGCFLAGIAAAYFDKHLSNDAMRLFIITGILGGFTTFSAFSLDVINMIHRNKGLDAIIYVSISVIGSILAAFTGLYMSEQNYIKLKVEPHFDGITLIKYLKKTKIGIPYALIQKLMRKKAIKVNGKRAKEDTVLAPHDEITMPAVSTGEVVKRKQVATQADADKLIKIIYEDKNCLAIDKPQGLATQGGNRVSLSVDDLLPFMQKGESRYFLTHRLDKDTTGVLLIAKTRQAAQLIGDSFKHRFVQKTYLALVAGKVLQYNGSINLPLGRRASTGGSEKVVVDEVEGKKAYTEWKVVRHYGNIATLLEVTPQTGRKHQIRAHLAAIGHPIIGDGKYGGSQSFVEGLPKNLHLHAWKLSHGENYFKPIEAEIPSKFDLTNIEAGE